MHFHHLVGFPPILVLWIHTNNTAAEWKAWQVGFLYAAAHCFASPHPCCLAGSINSLTSPKANSVFKYNLWIIELTLVCWISWKPKMPALKFEQVNNYWLSRPSRIWLILVCGRKRTETRVGPECFFFNFSLLFSPGGHISTNNKNI